MLFTLFYLPADSLIRKMATIFLISSNFNAKAAPSPASIVMEMVNGHDIPEYDFSNHAVIPVKKAVSNTRNRNIQSNLNLNTLTASQIFNNAVKLWAVKLAYDEPKAWMRGIKIRFIIILLAIPTKAIMLSHFKLLLAVSKVPKM